VLRYDVEPDCLREPRSFGKPRIGIADEAPVLAPFGLDVKNNGRDAAPGAVRRCLSPGGAQALSRAAGSTS
jgi:hypothetical protein